MSLENGTSQHLNHELSIQAQRIHEAVEQAIGSSTTVGRWGAGAMSQLTIDYNSALTEIDRKCNGRWNGVRAITSQVEYCKEGSSRICTRPTTLIVPVGELESPYFCLDEIMDKSYLDNVSQKRLGVRMSFLTAFYSLTENNNKACPPGIKVVKGKNITYGSRALPKMSQ